MTTTNKDHKVTIGATALVDFGYTAIKEHVAARVDSGARTSALWASNIVADGDKVSFQLLGEGHPDFTGDTITLPIIGRRTVQSSNGVPEDRYVVELPVVIAGVALTGQFTLSDRSTQRYPILIGRRILNGNFVVDCSIPGDGINQQDLEEEYNTEKAN